MSEIDGTLAPLLVEGHVVILVWVAHLQQSPQIIHRLIFWKSSQNDIGSLFLAVLEFRQIDDILLQNWHRFQREL